ncbi:MAG: Dabb family protein [Acidimicrobiia bacterium]|jgi:hypothetical protein|nr:Dabb family protein [Acidimicrobiia bacterium]
MGFRHIALLTFAPGTDVDAIAEALHALPAQIPELRHYDVGRDAGLAADNADLAVVAVCDDRAGYEAYRDHPAHLAVIAEHIAPHLIARTALQHPLAGGAPPSR